MTARRVYKRVLNANQFRLLYLTPDVEAVAPLAGGLERIPEFSVEPLVTVLDTQPADTPGTVDCLLISDAYTDADIKRVAGVARKRWPDAPILLSITDSQSRSTSEESLSAVDDCLCEAVVAADQSVAKHRILSSIEKSTTQAKLHRQRGLLRRTQALAGVGGWEYDPANEALRWTEQVYKIHDLPLEHQPTVDDALGFYHEKDRPDIRDKLETLLQTGEPFSLKIRLVTATDAVKWVRVRGDADLQNGRVQRTRGTIHDVTDYVEQQTETETLRKNLRDEKERLERLSNVLNHELRNPLTVIDGQLRLYREQGDRSHLDTVERNVDRLSEVIDDTLWLVQDDDTVSEMSMVDVEQVATAAWRTVGSDTVSLHTESMERIPANESLLQTVFEKLFENTLEHTTASRIDVGPCYMGDSVEGFYVADDGEGFDSSSPDAVFEFGIDQTSGESGIGLAVVREIVQRHDWSITATEGERGGARVEVGTGIF